MTRSRNFYVIVCLATFVLAGCHSLTTTVHGGNPPQFSFSAGRFAECCTNLAFLGVYEVAAENVDASWSQQRKDNVVLWQIWPASGTDNSANALPTITYGIVPAGWVQKVPANGSPPSLIEGRSYEVGGPAVEVPQSYIRFVIHNGKAIEVPIAGK